MKERQPTDQRKPAIKTIRYFDKGACEPHLDEALKHNSFHLVLMLDTDFSGPSHGSALRLFVCQSFTVMCMYLPGRAGAEALNPIFTLYRGADNHWASNQQH